VRGWKLETRSSKLETGSSKLETGVQQPISSIQYPVSSIQRLDRLQLGSDLTAIRWGQRRIIPLPTSALPEVRDLPPAT